MGVTIDEMTGRLNDLHLNEIFFQQLTIWEVDQIASWHDGLAHYIWKTSELFESKL